MNTTLRFLVGFSGAMAGSRMLTSGVAVASTIRAWAALSVSILTMSSSVERLNISESSVIDRPGICSSSVPLAAMFVVSVAISASSRDSTTRAYRGMILVRSSEISCSSFLLRK